MLHYAVPLFVDVQQRYDFVGIINVRKYYIRSYKLTLEADMKQAKF